MKCLPKRCGKIKLEVSWWTIKAEMKDGSFVVIDKIDMVPQPFVTDDGYVYFIKGKEYTLKDFKKAELFISGVCSDPKCTDPDCVNYRKTGII